MTPAVAAYVGLVVARTAAFAAVMPLFAGRTPRTVRAALALALAAFYLGQVAPAWDHHVAGQAKDIHWLAYSMALIRELLLGGAMGFVFGLFLLPARIAGEFLTQQIGLAISPQVGPTGEQPAGPLTLVLESAAAVTFLELDGHHVVLGALHASFAKLPLGGALFPEAAGPALRGLTSAYQMGLLLAGPLGLCLFLLSVVLAIMTRAAPQLSIQSIGFTLQVMTALIGGLMFMPDLVQLMAVMIGRFGSSIDGFFG